MQARKDAHKKYTEISANNNKELMDKHLTREERENYVIARTALCAFWVKPALGEKGNIIGSRIRYVYSGDTGGSIPASIQRWLSPKTALESLKSVILYGNKKTNQKHI